MNISYADGMAVLSAEITPLEKCTLMALLLHMHPVTGQSFPSQATLAKETGCSERQIRRVLANLKSKCLIEIHQPGPGSKRHTPSYTMPFADAYRYIEECNARYSAKRAEAKNASDPDSPSPDNCGALRKKKFMPPSIDEVAEYIYQKRYAIDPDEFFDYYESIGCIAAGQPIRSWKSKCDIWQRRMDAENS